MARFAITTFAAIMTFALSSGATSAFSEEELKELRDYSSGVIFLNNVGLMKQSPANPPKFLTATVKDAANECFPKNEVAREWIEKMLSKGHPAVWNVFFIQSFRNSALAKNLRQRYLAASEDERKKMMEEMQALVGNKMAYELLFESSFRPLLFTTAKSPPEDLAQCRANYTSQSCQDDRIANPASGEEAIHVCHWECDQPQIYYVQRHPKKSGDGTFRTQDGSFTFYLGNKGSWSLATYGESTLITATPPEGTAERILKDGPYQRANKQHREATYCELSSEPCPPGKLRPAQDITEAEGRACLARFFTGSQEAVSKRPAAAQPRMRNPQPTLPGNR